MTVGIELPVAGLRVSTVRSVGPIPKMPSTPVDKSMISFKEGLKSNRDPPEKPVLLEATPML